MRHAVAAAGSLFVLLVVVIAGCGEEKPTAGGKCNLTDEGKSVCLDAKTAGLCTNLRLQPYPCLGPRGCTGPGTSSYCDATVAREGDPCDPKTEDSYDGTIDRTCSEDKTRSLACRGGKFVLDRLCRGSKGCDAAAIAAGSMNTCDRSVAELGDPCAPRHMGSVVEGVGVCSVDRKASLVCDKDDKGQFIVGNTCDGPKGCKPGSPTGDLDHRGVCDQSVAAPGSACGKLDTNAVSCSPDGALVVTCDPSSLKWIEHKKCGPKTKCAYQKGKVVIDSLPCAPTP